MMIYPQGEDTGCVVVPVAWMEEDQEYSVQGQANPLRLQPELVRESSHRLRAQEVQNQRMKRRRRRRGLSVVGGGCGGQIQGSLIKQQLLELRGIFDNQNQLSDSVHIIEDQRGKLTANELNVFLDTQCTSITTCPTINKPTKLLIVSHQN